MNIDFAAKGFVMNPDGSYSKPKRDPKIPPVLQALAKRIRQDTKPLMNKLESEFMGFLQARYGLSRIMPQAIRFKLGNGIWYKPDFVVSFDMAFEVKGPHSFRGGFENLKVAASLYPEIEWWLVWKDDSQWKQQQVLP